MIQSTAAAGSRWRSYERGFRLPPARPAADAEARAMGGQAEAEHQQAASRAQGLSLPSAREDDRRGEPSLGCGHNRYTDAAGFLYLVAIIDWATRRVLSWRLSNTLTAGSASRR